MKRRKLPRKQRRSGRPRNLSHASLPKRSEAARDGALHVISAMRRDPKSFQSPGHELSLRLRTAPLKPKDGLSGPPHPFSS